MFYADLFTFTKKILNRKLSFFCIYLCKQIHRKTTVKKKITFFFVNLCYFFIHILYDFFIVQCLDVRFKDLLYFYLFEILSTVLVSSSSKGENMLI